MKKFRVTGFSKYGVWGEVEVETIAECVPMRAAEKGIVEISKFIREKHKSVIVNKMIY